MIYVLSINLFLTTILLFENYVILVWTQKWQCLKEPQATWSHLFSWKCNFKNKLVNSSHKTKLNGKLCHIFTTKLVHSCQWDHAIFMIYLGRRLEKRYFNGYMQDGFLWLASQGFFCTGMSVRTHRLICVFDGFTFKSIFSPIAFHLICHCFVLLVVIVFVHNSLWAHRCWKWYEWWMNRQYTMWHLD